MPCKVEKSVKSQKLEKAPGPDKITNETLQGTIEELCPILTEMFSECLKNKQIPNQWALSFIILIHKGGEKDEMGNYRPISLMSNIYKIFAKIILDRITIQLDENQPVEQAGFRRNFSTIDHIHTVKQIIEKYKEYNKPLYLAFIDYRKAFDSLHQCKIWESLKEQGINRCYIDILREVYENCSARVQLETLGDEFTIKRGVRQGDPVSPKLFSAVLENIFRQLNWQNMGLNIDGRRLHHLRFADDIVLFEERPENLQNTIQNLSNEMY